MWILDESLIYSASTIFIQLYIRIHTLMKLDITKENINTDKKK